MESFTYKRRLSRRIWVGSVPVGGGAAISVQSMTTTKTEDISATLAQIRQLFEVGCDLVRVTVNTQKAAEVLSLLVKESPIPLIADIHFDYRLALAAIESGVGCVRINPGNIGTLERFQKVVEAAKARGVCLRIGVNAGSVEKRLLKKYGRPCAEALVESALEAASWAERWGFKDYKISIKSSDVLENYKAYFLLAQQTQAPLHVGVTEAGTRDYGMVKSAVGIGSLLLAGIGDTIRVSLSCDPVEEVKAGLYILKCLGLRSNMPEVIACPSCGRADIDVFELAKKVEQKALALKKDIKIAVMGCVVNGPGESKEADIGIAGGRGEGVIYKKGKIFKKVKSEELLPVLLEEVERL